MSICQNRLRELSARATDSKTRSVKDDSEKYGGVLSECACAMVSEATDSRVVRRLLGVSACATDSKARSVRDGSEKYY